MSAVDHADLETKNFGVSNSNTQQPRRPRRYLRLVIGGGIFVLLGAVAGAFMAFRAGSWKSSENIRELPEIPTVNLDDADPAIAKIVRETRELVEQSPQAGGAWGKYAMVLQAHGFYNAAHICYDTAMKLDPEDPRWPYLQGDLHNQGRGGAEAALPYFKLAAGLNSPDFHYRLCLADTLLELGHWEEAEKEYRAVLAISQDPQAQLGMGKLAIARREYRESLPYLQSATEQLGMQKTACSLLVTVYERLGDQVSADRARQRLAEMPRDRVRTNDPVLQVSDLEVGLPGELRKTVRLIYENRSQELVAVVEKLVERYPDSYESWAALCNAYQMAGEFAGMERAARKCIQIAPKNAEGWLNLGNALLSQQRYQEALEAVQKSLALNSQQGAAYYSLGECRKGLGDHAGAAEAFKLAGVEPPPSRESAPAEQEPEPPHAIQRNIPLMTFYYVNPQPELAKQVLEDLVSPENLDHPWYKGRVIFLQLMASNLGDVGFGQADLVRHFESKFTGAPEGGKRIIIKALETCGDKTTEQVVEKWLTDTANVGVQAELTALQKHLASPDRKRLRDRGVQEPRDLDFLWGDFFATGDYAPISRILDVFDLPDTAANNQLKQAAQVSAITNFQQHPKLVKIVKKNLDMRQAGSKAAVKEVFARLEIAVGK